MSGELKKRGIRGFVWAAGESIGVAVISFVSFVLLARLLAPQDFGIVALATVFIFFSNLATGHGLADALVQRRKIVPAHLDTAFWSTLGLAIVLMGLCMAIAGPVAALFDEPRLADVLPWLSLSLPLGAITTVQTALLRRDMRFDSVARRTLAGRAAGAVAGIGLAVMGYGLWSLVVQQLVGQLALAIAFLSVPWRPRWRFSPAHLKETWGFGFHVSAAQIVTGIGEQVLTLAIGTMLGTAALGYFTIAWRAVQLIKSLVSTAVYHVGLSAFSKLQADRDALRDAFMNATRIACLAGFPLAAGIALLADPIVRVVLAAKWEPSIPLLALLALELIPAFFGMFLSALYRATDRSAWSLYMSIAYAATGAACVFAAAPYGVEAAVGSWVARSLILMPVHVVLVSRVLGLLPGQVASLAVVPFLAAAIMTATIISMRLVLPPDLAPVIALGLIVPAAGTIFAAATYSIDPSLARLVMRAAATMTSRPHGRHDDKGAKAMHGMKLKRRGVVIGLAGTLVPATMPMFDWLSRAAPSRTIADLIFTDRTTARRVGAHYLASHADENDAAKLAACLPDYCGDLSATAPQIRFLREAIDVQRRRDFASGNTVVVDGWILARTEARLCALVSLTT